MRILYTFLCLCVTLTIFAQNAQEKKEDVSNIRHFYSYTTDRKFKEIRSLIGYNFKPSDEEQRDERKKKIEPGKVSFGITGNNLYVEGEGIRGVYSINTMIPTEYGYQLKLMNANNPMLTGHLKIFLNDFKEVDAFMFKRSPKENEIIYYQSYIKKDLSDQEQAYFTDRNELKINEIDDIWGKKIRPFFIIDGESAIQDRFQMSDDVSFEFIENQTIVEKGRRRDNSSKAADGSSDSTQSNKKIKILKENTVVVSRKVIENGKVVDSSVKFDLKDATLKEDRESGNSDDRFLLTLKPKNKRDPEIYVYLNAQKAVSYIDFDGQRYLMRGF